MFSVDEQSWIFDAVITCIDMASISRYLLHAYIQAYVCIFSLRVDALRLGCAVVSGSYCIQLADQSIQSCHDELSRLLGRNRKSLYHAEVNLLYEIELKRMTGEFLWHRIANH